MGQCSGSKMRQQQKIQQISTYQTRETDVQQLISCYQKNTTKLEEKRAIHQVDLEQQGKNQLIMIVNDRVCENEPIQEQQQILSQKNVRNIQSVQEEIKDFSQDHQQQSILENQKIDFLSSNQQQTSYQANKYTQFIESNVALVPKKITNITTKKLIDSIQVLSNGELQPNQFLDNNHQAIIKSNKFSCFCCEMKIDLVVYITPCSHQHHLKCLLDRITQQIKNQQYKITCKCGQRIHINFLRRIDIENRLNLITQILNAQVEQLIKENQDKFEDLNQIQEIFAVSKSKQDYYYGMMNNCSQQLLQTEVTPGQ